MKRLLWFLITLALLAVKPVSVFAALLELPIGSTNKIVAHAVQNTDWVDFALILRKSNGEYERQLGLWQFTKYYGEPINNIAQRSADELVKAMQTIMREIVRTVLASKIGPTLEGRLLSFEYHGMNDTPSGGRNAFVSVFGGVDNYFSISRTAMGTLSAPEVAYKVDIVVAATWRLAVAIFAPGVQHVQIIREDESGNTLEVINGSDGYNPNGPNIYPEDGMFYIDTALVLGNILGKFRIWLTNGTEQVFNLADGSELVTYLPSPPVTKPFRKLGIPKLLSGEIELRFEATDDESIRIEDTGGLTRWSEASLSTSIPRALQTISDKKLPVRIRTVRLPLDARQRFYRAMVEPTVTP